MFSYKVMINWRYIMKKAEIYIWQYNHDLTRNSSKFQFLIIHFHKNMRKIIHFKSVKFNKNMDKSCSIIKIHD